MKDETVPGVVLQMLIEFLGDSLDDRDRGFRRFSLCVFDNLMIRQLSA